MAKKVKTIEVPNTPEKTAEEIHEIEKQQRNNLINEYNKNNSTTRINPDIIPTVDDIKSFKEDFENEYKELCGLTYCIADADSALSVAEFLLDWNTNYVNWRKDLWKGVIKFDEVIRDIIDNIHNNTNRTAPLEIDYAALSYLYMTMMEPAGVGLKSAKDMEKIDPTYSAILEAIGTNVDMFNQRKEYIDLLQRRWAFAEQGYYLELLTNSAEPNGN